MPRRWGRWWLTPTGALCGGKITRRQALRFGSASCDQFVHDVAQSLQVEGLFERHVGLIECGRLGLLEKCAEQDHARARLKLLEACGEIDAAHPRHAQVRDDHL